jgi:large subunit ribosomal protein L16
MLLMPKKAKYRKQQKGRAKGIESRAVSLAFGSFGLKAMEAKWLSARQLEASRRAIIRYLKKGGKLWIRVFPDKPVTTKGVEVPMGGGKGSVDHYAAVVKPGRIIFEVDGIDEKTAREAFEKAAAKLPILTKFVKK